MQKSSSTHWLDRIGSRSLAGPCVPESRRRAYSCSASLSAMLSHRHDPSNSNVSWAEDTATPETLGENYSTERHENNEGPGSSLASPPYGTLHIAPPRSSGSPASSAEVPTEESIPFGPRSGLHSNGKDQSYTVLFSNSPSWAQSSTASLLVVGTNRHSRWISNPCQGVSSHRLSLDDDPLRELPRNVARSRKRVNLTCDVPPLPSVRRPCTTDDRATSSEPSRFPTASSLTTSRVVDSKLAMDLFESWTRGEALPVSITHRGHARSAPAGSQPKSYHYRKRSSSSFSQPLDLEALARVGSVAVRTSRIEYKGRLASRSGKSLRSPRDFAAHAPTDDYHDPEDEGLEANGDETSPAPSTCGPITPLSAQFFPTAVNLPSSSHRASVSVTIEEDLERGYDSTTGPILVPDLRFRSGFVRSHSPHPASRAPATVLTPFVNDNDAAFFIHPRPAPKPPMSDGSADLAPEILATRALLVTLTQRTPYTPLTEVSGGVAVENPKGRSANDGVCRRKSLRSRLSGIGHFGLKNLGVRVKTEPAGRVHYTS